MDSHALARFVKEVSLNTYLPVLGIAGRLSPPIQNKVNKKPLRA